MTKHRNMACKEWFTSDAGLTPRQILVTMVYFLLLVTVNGSRNTDGVVQFDSATPRNVTAEVEKTVFLQCRVINRNDNIVSWIRKRDLQILTIGNVTYTPDKRFRVIHERGSVDWTLQIKSPQLDDSGLYECQVSTSPKMMLYINLSILASEVEIRAPTYVVQGQSLRLECNVTANPRPPVSVYWYHNDSRLSENTHRTQVIVERREFSTLSILIVNQVKKTDSGKYTCKAHASKGSSAEVVVVNGKRTEAIKSDSASSAISLYSQNAETLTLLLSLASTVLRATRL